MHMGHQKDHNKIMIKIKLNENLLNEEVIGAQAFVYHGSKTPPNKFIPYFSDDKFSPGFGSGGMYGSGLYCVYNLLNTQTSRGNYGQFIYKFKINLYGFIIFNMDIAEKVYGKRLTPANQAILIGKNELISNLYYAYNDNNPSKITSEYALKASKFLEGKVKGMVFTGGNDGDVAVIYDASIATLVSYLDLSRQDKEDFRWQPIDASIVKNQIKKNLDDKFKNDKYKYYQDLSQTTEFHHSVLVSGKQARQIKEGSIFHRDLTITNASEIDIPKNIKVTRTFRLDTCWISKIPDGIEVDKLQLHNCKKLRELSNIKINGELSIYQCPDLVSISMDLLNLRGPFYIYGCPNLQTLPNKIVIENGDVNIIDCLNLRKLPDLLVCSGLYINDDETKLELPESLHLNPKHVPSYLDAGSFPIITPPRLWDEFVEKIRKTDIPQYDRLSKLYNKPLENVDGNYSYLDESMIAEMPIKNYQTIGNFEKPGTFKGPDQKMMNHPGYIRKLERFFSRSRYDMNFWMSHKPGMRREREQGIISPEKVRELFPKEADAILKEHEDAITVIFLGNYGDNKVMMTPWIVAHRMGHAFTASNRYSKTSTSGHLWKEMEQSIFDEIHSMMRDKYGMMATRLAGYNANLNDSYRQIFETIGTSKSARDKNLPRPYEFLYECLAQFIMTGEIKFNPMPPRIGAGKKTFGKYQSFYRWNGTDEERKEFADDLADLMTWRMDDILSGSLNDIFLM